jgi:hypothetical protein
VGSRKEKISIKTIKTSDHCGAAGASGTPLGPPGLPGKTILELPLGSPSIGSSGLAENGDARGTPARIASIMVATK